MGITKNSWDLKALTDPMVKIIDWFVALVFWQQVVVIVVLGLFWQFRIVHDA